MFKQQIDFVENYLNFIVNDGQTRLPSKIPQGGTVEWSVREGEAEVRDNVIYKTPQSQENEPIILTAKLKCGDECCCVTVDKLILKDAYVANIMSYFTNRDDTRGMKISYSYDCKDFQPLNGARSVLVAQNGTRRMRDPHIFRTKDGGFAVAATHGWANPEIYLYDTDGLIEFSNERFAMLADTVGKTTGEQEITTQRTWAPEINYDRVTDKYVIYWSDPTGSVYSPKRLDRPIYFNTSSDLVNFSEPDVYFETGYRIIDASIRHVEGRYYMAVKNEEDMLYGTIFMASSSTLYNRDWQTSHRALAGVGVEHPKAEGPTIGYSYTDGNYYIYFDEFTGNGVTAVRNKDITNELGWEYADDCSMAPDKVKGLFEDDKLVSHCGIIDVTQKELDRIIAKWGEI